MLPRAPEVGCAVCAVTKRVRHRPGRPHRGCGCPALEILEAGSGDALGDGCGKRAETLGELVEQELAPTLLDALFNALLDAFLECLVAEELFEGERGWRGRRAW
jgi:hypothetical protein